MKQLVIIGHGMVAQRLLERLVAKHAFREWQLTVIGAEPRPAYNRILLSTWLAGGLEASELTLAGPDWYQRHGIRCISGNAALAIDRKTCRVLLADGETVAYDHLVLATGAEPVVPPLPGHELDGVQVFRDWDDADNLRRCPDRAREAVVIGGGFLGLEAAAGLNQHGVRVTVLQRGGHLLDRQLDATAGTLLQNALSQQGLTLRCNVEAEAIVGRDRVEGVRLTDGTLIPAQRVVVAVGIKPRLALGREAGLDCDRGIRVDRLLRSSDPRISALGECCQLGDQTYGLVEPGYRQAEVLAARLAGTASNDLEPYRDSAVPTRLKISGVELFSCGEIATGEGIESLVYQDRELGHYRHLLIREARLVGAILYGDTRDGPWYFKQVQNSTDISTIRQHLAFGAAYCEAA